MAEFVHNCFFTMLRKESTLRFLLTRALVEDNEQVACGAPGMFVCQSCGPAQGRSAVRPPRLRAINRG
eukprot:6878545-Prorocentrum_lima.AAC.1